MKYSKSILIIILLVLIFSLLVISNNLLKKNNRILSFGASDIIGDEIYYDTSANAMGLSLTNPSSTLSIFGNFAVNNGGSIDTFQISQLGGATSSNLAITKI